MEHRPLSPRLSRYFFFSAFPQTLAGQQRHETSGRHAQVCVQTEAGSKKSAQRAVVFIGASHNKPKHTLLHIQMSANVTEILFGKQGVSLVLVYASI